STIVLTPQTESRLPSLLVTITSHLNESTNVWVGAFGQTDNKPAMSLVESVSPPLKTETTVDIPMKARLGIRDFSKIEISAAIEKAKRSVVARETLSIIKANARVTPNLRVGYIRGFDFSLPNALNALGVESKELSIDEVKTGDLSQF